MISIVPERLAERMEALGISQSAVARAIGVQPPSISRLVKGKHAQTRHIFSLARAVRTTPEYLTGVTDDPAEDADLGQRLTIDEQEVITLYAQLTDDQRSTMRKLLRDLARLSAEAPTKLRRDEAGIAGAH